MLELETVSPGFGNKTRRAFLQVGFLGIGSLTLADLLKLQAKAAVKPVQSDTAVILLWCGGGPSQLETYDMKPDAPSEIRGPMNAIKSNVLGINVCELLPHHAQVAEKFTIIRSVSHGHAGHPDGTFRFTSGFGQDKVGGLFGIQTSLHHRSGQSCLGNHTQRHARFARLEQRLSLVRFAGLLGRNVSCASGVARVGELAIAGEARPA